MAELDSGDALGESGEIEGSRRPHEGWDIPVLASLFVAAAAPNLAPLAEGLPLPSVTVTQPDLRRACLDEPVRVD